MKKLLYSFVVGLVLNCSLHAHEENVLCFTFTSYPTKELLIKVSYQQEVTESDVFSEVIVGNISVEKKTIKKYLALIAQKVTEIDLSCIEERLAFISVIEIRALTDVFAERIFEKFNELTNKKVEFRDTKKDLAVRYSKLQRQKFTCFCFPYASCKVSSILLAFSIIGFFLCCLCLTSSHFNFVNSTSGVELEVGDPTSFRFALGALVVSLFLGTCGSACCCGEVTCTAHANRTIDVELGEIRERYESLTIEGIDELTTELAIYLDSCACKQRVIKRVQLP